MKLLILDDDDCVIDLFSIRSQPYGHTIIPASYPHDALSLLLANPDITAIFSDYHLPCMNGYDFCKTIREAPSYLSFQKIPIIGIGSFLEEHHHILTLFRPKPLNYTTLFEEVSRIAEGWIPTLEERVHPRIPNF